MTPDIAVLKEEAAVQALDEVKDGLALGLGSGTTCNQFIELLGERLRQGTLRDVRGVPTSKFTAAQARRLGIPLTTLAEIQRLDLAIDGADEVDGDLNMIKGLGKALLREKIVEVHASRFVVIVDETKLSPRLGLHEPLPVEVVPFEAEATERWLQSVATRAELWREEGQLIRSDNDNYLARCWFEDGIDDVYRLAAVLAARPGVVEHGLFLDMATKVIVGSSRGARVLERRS